MFFDSGWRPSGNSAQFVMHYEKIMIATIGLNDLKKLTHCLNAVTRLSLLGKQLFSLNTVKISFW